LAEQDVPVRMRDLARAIPPAALGEGDGTPEKDSEDPCDEQRAMIVRMDHTGIDGAGALQKPQKGADLKLEERDELIRRKVLQGRRRPLADAEHRRFDDLGQGLHMVAERVEAASARSGVA